MVFDPWYSGGTQDIRPPRSGLLVRMAVGLLGMLVPLLAMLVSRRRVLLGLLVLPVGVMGLEGKGAHAPRIGLRSVRQWAGRPQWFERLSGPRLKRPSKRDESGEAEPWEMPRPPPTRLTESASGEFRVSAYDRLGSCRVTLVDIGL